MLQNAAAVAVKKEGFPTRPSPKQRRLFVCALALSTLCNFTSILFNGILNDVQAPIADLTRDWATAFSAALCIVLALVARYRPSLVKTVPLTCAAVALVIAGVTCSWTGVALSNSALVIAGSTLKSLADVWATVLWLVYSSELPIRWMLVAFASGGLLAIPLALGVSALGYHAALILHGGTIVATMIFCAVQTLPTLEAFSRGEAPADIQLLQPRAVLPLTHDLFIYIFAFFFAYGFALRYEGSDGGLLANWSIALTLALIVGYALLSKAEPRVDMLFNLAFALIIGGFLLVLLDDARITQVAATTLLCGNSAFYVLMTLALGALAARNRSNMVSALAWGYAAYHTGIDLGAQLGMWATGLPEDMRLVARAAVALILFALVVYTLLSLRDFGFDKTIATVEPNSVPEMPEEQLTDTVEARCEELGELFKLTERERDVFRLLARGNNTLHIQEKLGITKNTLKYHVRHIYEKASVHSQQELIDLL